MSAAHPLLTSNDVLAGGMGDAQASAVVVVGNADLAGVGSPPPPTRARLRTEDGAPELTCTVKVTVALELAANAVVLSQTMLGAVDVQVKALRVKGEAPLNVNPVGNTSTTRIVPAVAVPPVLLTTKA